MALLIELPDTEKSGPSTFGDYNLNPSPAKCICKLLKQNILIMFCLNSAQVGYLPLNSNTVMSV